MSSQLTSLIPVFDSSNWSIWSKVMTTFMLQGLWGYVEGTIAVPVIAAGLPLVTLSKKESRTKVAKNCTKSLYSQVSVKIFDKVKQSHLSVSQSQLKLEEKSPKKKALTRILSDNMI